MLKLPPAASVSFTCTQHPLKLQQLQSRIDIYKYSFLPETIIQWNCLEIPNLDTMDLVIGLRRLCRHNFKHNRGWKA